jgi:hypothetical protein
VSCIRCGNKKARLYVSADFSETTCKECGFQMNVDLDGWEPDRYRRRGMLAGEWKEVPEWCLLVMAWEAEP